MNTHAEYRRHSHRPQEPTVPAPEVEEALSQVARHRDPSLAASQPTTPSENAQRITWVRPTELASFTSPAIGRGVDLQAELIRRARRTPATATRSVRRRARHSLTTREPITPRQEGLEL